MQRMAVCLLIVLGYNSHNHFRQSLPVHFWKVEELFFICHKDWYVLHSYQFGWLYQINIPMSMEVIQGGEHTTVWTFVVITNLDDEGGQQGLGIITELREDHRVRWRGSVPSTHTVTENQVEPTPLIKNLTCIDSALDHSLGSQLGTFITHFICKAAASHIPRLNVAEPLPACCRGKGKALDPLVPNSHIQ